jgi:hypothetical protein
MGISKESPLPIISGRIIGSVSENEIEREIYIFHHKKGM